MAKKRKVIGGLLDKALVEVFHRTTPESADAIRATKLATTKEPGFFVSNVRDGQAVGYGDDVVTLKVPERDLLLDDEFPSGEQHYRINPDSRTHNLSKYDPKSLMTGGAGLAGLLALGQSEDSEASFLGQAAKTADHFMLGVAQKMKAAGINRDEIWRKTGWGEGVDGKWRFEVDDSGTALTEKAKEDHRYGSVGDMLTGHQGFGQYPQDLANIDVGITAGPSNGSNGSYTPYVDRGADTFPITEQIDVEGADRRSILGHELQHAIQHREGFATGGNPSEYYADFKYDYDVAMQEVGRLNNELSNNVLFRDKLKNVLPEATPDSRPHIEKKIAELDDEYQQLMNEKLSYAAQASSDPSEKAFDKYRRLAGEVEARNVQTRLNMDNKARRETPPWQTQDVPDNLQVRGNIDPTLLATMGVGSAGVAAAPIMMNQRSLEDLKRVEALDDFKQRRASKKKFWDSVKNAPLEIAAGVNRAATDTANFLLSDVPNAALQLGGSDVRVPSLYSIPGVSEATQGNFMPDSDFRNSLRYLTELYSPI